MRQMTWNILFVSLHPAGTSDGSDIYNVKDIYKEIYMKKLDVCVDKQNTFRKNILDNRTTLDFFEIPKYQGTPK